MRTDFYKGQGMKKSLGLVCACIIASSCGGGGGTGDDASPNTPVIPSNQSPNITSPSTVTMAENSDSIAYTIVATDPDNDSLTYEVSGADAVLFSISQNGTELSFINTPDFETPLDADRDNKYEIEVNVSDDKGGSTAQNVTIEVANENHLQAVIHFPLPNAYGTNNQSFMQVSGSIVDLEDDVVEDTDSANIKINGISPEFNAPLNTRWTASIPIQSGVNEISLKLGDTIVQTQQFNNAIVRDFGAYAYDKQNNRVFYVDRVNSELLVLDIATNITSSIKKDTTDFGSVVWDNFNERLLALNYQREMIEIDVSSGESNILIDPSAQANGASWWGSIAREFLVFDGGNKAVSVLPQSRWVVAADLVSGVLSNTRFNTDSLSGFHHFSSRSFAIDRQTQKGLLFGTGRDGNNFGGRFYWVDLATGSIEIASTTCDREDLNFEIHAMHYDAQNNYAYVWGFGNLAIVRVDTCEFVSEMISTYAGGTPKGADIDIEKNRIFIKQYPNAFSFSNFDFSSGDRSVDLILEETKIGASPIIPFGHFSVSEDQTSLIGFNSIPNELGFNASYNISSVNLIARTSTLLLDLQDAQSDKIYFPRLLTFSKNNSKAYLTTGYDSARGSRMDGYSLFEVDLISGRREPIYAFNSDNDNAIVLSEVIDLALNEDANILYILAITNSEIELDDYPLSLLALDLKTHDLNIIKNQDIGSGAELGTIANYQATNSRQKMAYDDTTRQILFFRSTRQANKVNIYFQSFDNALLSVTPETGEGIVISSTSIGDGPLFWGGSALYIDNTANRYILNDFGRTIAVDRNTGVRSILNTSSFRLNAFDSEKQIGYSASLDGIFAIDINTGELNAIVKN